MGVPKFASWIYANRTRKLTIPYVPKNVCSLSFDVNSIIHGCAQVIYNYGEGANEQRKIAITEMSDDQLEKELFKFITDTILRIVERVYPKQFLVLAVDGVAPLAKIQQQRCRRYRMATGSTSAEILRFDPNCITPGTDFMFRLDEYFKKWIQDHMSILPEKVLYSNHMVSGEGEQKIFDYVRSRELSGYGAHIIYGLDADLILLSLISRLNGIYLLREKGMEQNVYERLIDINEVREYLYERMRSDTALDDFAVLSFFLGNDFVPTSPMFVGDMNDTIEFLIDIYVHLNLRLTYPSTGRVDIRNFKRFLYLLADNEEFRLKEVYRYPPKLGFKTLELSAESYMYRGETKVKLNKDEFRMNWYTKVFSPPKDTDFDISNLPDSIYLELFDPSDDKIESLVYDYITSFFWTYLYYKKGTSFVSPNFCYFSGYAPLIEDVARYITTYNRNAPPLFKNEIKDDYSFTVLHQLLAVLPMKSMSIIPKDLHKFYDIDSPICDMFPTKVEVDTEAKDMERLGVVRMCPVEPKRLLELDLGISNEKMKQYESQKDICFRKKSQDPIPKKDTHLESKDVGPIISKENKITKNESTSITTPLLGSVTSGSVTSGSVTSGSVTSGSVTSGSVTSGSDDGKSVKSKFLQDFEKLKRLRKNL
jgi:5'-3' exonuclease